jgi:soluble lytic murein transglycosylase
MSKSARFLVVCSAALFFTLGCMRSATSRNEAPSPDAPSSVAPLSELAPDVVLSPEDQTESALANTRRADSEDRTPDGQLPQLTPQEHMRRAAIYHANRAFNEAREHWRAVIDRYPNDPNVPNAIFLTGRSLFQERRYEEALPYFEQLGDSYTSTPSGRDGFYYVAATKLRLGRADEAAARYAEYIDRFPAGERVEQAYLNIIDTLREAGRPDDAIPWIERTRQRFPGTVTDTNAVFARLRLDVSRGDWPSAVRTSEQLGLMTFARGVATSKTEVAYLRAYALERSGRKEQAAEAYRSIPDSLDSYYGGLATARLRAMGGAARKEADDREARVRAEAVRGATNYPAPFRDALLRAVRGRSLDPRLMLSIMRQESGFRPTAKSQAGARGLMQLTVDAAARYGPQAGLSGVSEEALYRAETSILVGGAYLDTLVKMFPGLPEAVAASYNGGEDNVARWVRRAGQKDPGVFTSDVGFTESKDYVLKVISNYRAYKLLYDEKLMRK